MDELLQEADVRLCEGERALLDAAVNYRQADPALYRKALEVSRDVRALRVEAAQRAGLVVA